MMEVFVLLLVSLLFNTTSEEELKEILIAPDASIINQQTYTPYPYQDINVPDGFDETTWRELSKTVNPKVRKLNR